MDAPVLPPSQEDVPAVIATAADQPPTLLPQPTTPPFLTNASSNTLLGVRAIELDQLTPSSNLSVSPRFDWFVSSQLSRSFSFLSRAFRSARLGTSLPQVQYSATVPIQWARTDTWKSWAATADIKVESVELSAERVEAENSPWSASYVQQCLPDAQRELQTDSAYRVSLRDKTIGYVTNENRANSLAKQLRQLVRQAAFEADDIAPRPLKKNRLNGATLLQVDAGGRSLFSVDDAMAEDLGYSKEWAAIAWANNLRVALEAEPMNVGAAHSSLQNLEESDIDIQGDASWYGPYFHGRATANGETYNQHDLTVAHKSLPFGTHLKVRNTLNDKTVVVRVNDRGPYVGDRSLDLSNAAAKCLGSDDIGVIPYEAVILKSFNK